MNKDASDFMMQEYAQIASAYFGLRDQINEWFKAYLALVGLPLTVLAAALKLGEDQKSISLWQLPDVVSGLLVAVAFLGFFLAMSIISMRLEMILYARTINGIRRYFAEADSQAGAHQPLLLPFLILPTTDSMPPFYESWRAMFWQVLLVGVLDGLILAVATQSLFALGLVLSVIVFLAYAALHWALYAYWAWRREKGWILHFPKGL
jgi:hypothetical protein